MIGKRIQQLRKKNGLSLSEVAERSGVAKSYLSAIERSLQDNPSISVLEKISSVLHVSVQTLLLPEDATPDTSELDPEWIEIAKEAMTSGISKEQFREFLEFQSWKSRRDDES